MRGKGHIHMIKNDGTNKSEKTKRNKTIVITSVVGALFLAVGTTSGILLGKMLSPHGMSYDMYDPATYEANSEAIYKRYLKASSDSYINIFTPSELVNIAIYKYSLEQYTSSITESFAKSLGVTQTTMSLTIKNDEYFNEAVSYSSFVKLAKRFYESDDNVSIYNGELVDTSNLYAVYDETVGETSSLTDFESQWGKTISRPVAYIISDLTTIEGNAEVDEASNNIIVHLQLDPITSVLRYVKQMQMMSSLSDAPEFVDINVTFTLSENLDLMRMDVSESYYIWAMGKNLTEASSSETFSIDAIGREIPAIDEKTVY